LIKIRDAVPITVNTRLLLLRGRSRFSSDGWTTARIDDEAADDPWSWLRLIDSFIRLGGTAQRETARSTIGRVHRTEWRERVEIISRPAASPCERIGVAIRLRLEPAEIGDAGLK
jgi:hypothetical protein